MKFSQYPHSRFRENRSNFVVWGAFEGPIFLAGMSVFARYRRRMVKLLNIKYGYNPSTHLDASEAHAHRSH